MNNKVVLKDIIVYITIILFALVLAHHLNVVASNSMESELYTGDVVLICYNPSSIEIGDIVVYNATWFSEPIIHRVISIQQSKNGETVYIIKGDNNTFPDPYPVHYKQIISKVIKINNRPIVIPKIGYITLWFQKLLH
jgi:signal peptidase